MSKKKIVGIVFGVLILGFVGLMALGASVSMYDYCIQLAAQASQSNENSQQFFGSDCLENADKWMTQEQLENEGVQEWVDALVAEKEALKARGYNP